MNKLSVGFKASYIKFNCLRKFSSKNNKKEVGNVFFFFEITSAKAFINF